MAPPSYRTKGVVVNSEERSHSNENTRSSHTVGPQIPIDPSQLVTEIPKIYDKISSKLQNLLQTPFLNKQKNIIGEEGEVGKLNGENQSTRKKL